MKTLTDLLGSRQIFCLALVAALVLLSGCIGIAPIPTSSDAYGRRLQDADVEFIHSGQTTRSEVKSRLGTKYASLPSEHAIAYPWETKGLIFDYYFFAYGPYGGGSEKLDYHGSPTGNGWHAFFVAFDANAVVRASGFKHLSRLPLQEQLQQWFDRLPKTPKSGE